jgi:hypothetical protein
MLKIKLISRISPGNLVSRNLYVVPKKHVEVKKLHGFGWG